MNIRKQMGKIYLFEALLCLRITNVIWVLILLQRGFTLAQVGIAEGVFHVASMLFEIPTGIIADVFGRKRTLALSGIAGTVSCVFMGFGSWEGWIYLGMVFSALNFNLASGTEEAILYDSLMQENEENTYKKRKFRLTMIADVCSSAGTLIGPLMLGLGYKNIYIICSILSLGSAVIAFYMKEPQVTELQRQRQTSPLIQWKKRLIEHIRNTMLFIKGHPRTICKLFANAAISCPGFLTLMYLQQHLVDCGLSKQVIGIPMLLIPLAGTVGSWMASKCSIRLFDAVMFCGLLGGIGTCFAGSEMLALSILGAVLGRWSLGYTDLAVSESTNHDFSSDQRATMVSVDCMFYSVLMVIASPVTGVLGEYFGMSVMFGVLGMSLCVMTMLFGLIYRKRK